MSNSNSVEQFVILAKTAKGAAAMNLVEQAVGSPGICAFGELLACPNIQELSASPEGKKYVNLLELFAYGSFSDYVQHREELPPVTEPMKWKLRQLSIVSLASTNRRISYPQLLRVLHLSNLRELEDLIIDAIYTELIKGKLDQQNQCLEVNYCRGRDVRPQDVAAISAVFAEWCDRCEEMVSSLEEQIKKADESKSKSISEQKKIEEEFSNLKKTLKVAAGASGGPDLDDIPGEVTSSKQEPERKKEKTRHKGGLRGSSNTSKIFSKH